MADDYTPIACGIHDVLEDRATRRVPVALRWRDEGGAERAATARIRDLFARGGAEYLVTDTGEEIRLDRLVSVG